MLRGPFFRGHSVVNIHGVTDVSNVSFHRLMFQAVKIVVRYTSYFI